MEVQVERIVTRMNLEEGRLEKYGHGGDRVSAAEKFPFHPDQFLDFSANINPMGPPPTVYKTMEQAMGRIDRYPDPGKRALTRKLSSLHHMEEDFILVGNGAAELLSLLFQAFRPRRVGLLSPSFVEYERMARIYGVEIVRYVAAEENEYRPHLQEMLARFEECDLILLGTPNNPTGSVYAREELLHLFAWSKARQILCVLDEAFIDFLPDQEQATLLPFLRHDSYFLLLRSLTKIYAIPGLRLGYALASPHMIRRLESFQVPWSVNLLAQEVGLACLDEKEYVEQTRVLIQQERSFLNEAITERLGWRVYPSAANYLLVRILDPFTVTDLQEVLGKRGILIRNASSYVGLTPFHFRIAVRTRTENARLMEEMARARDLLLSRVGSEQAPVLFVKQGEGER